MNRKGRVLHAPFSFVEPKWGWFFGLFGLPAQLFFQAPVSAPGAVAPCGNFYPDGCLFYVSANYVTLPGKFIATAVSGFVRNDWSWLKNHHEGIP